jgi:outer membrane biosynthesis protein TonB
MTCQITAQSTADSTLPVIVSVPAPEYPAAAKEAGIGGEVYVIVLIDKKGRTKAVDWYGPIAPCSNLDDPLTASVQAAAVEAAKKATFVPATYKGKPVDKGITLTYVFDPKKGSTAAADQGLRSKRLGPEMTPPVALKIPKAHYPDIWGQIGGLVTVKMLIYEDGVVHYAGAISGNRELRRPAVEAACGSTFKPAMVDGKPVRVEYVIEHNFYHVYVRG